MYITVNANDVLGRLHVKIDFENALMLTRFREDMSNVFNRNICELVKSDEINSSIYGLYAKLSSIFKCELCLQNYCCSSLNSLLFSYRAQTIKHQSLNEIKRVRHCSYLSECERCDTSVKTHTVAGVIVTQPNFILCYTKHQLFQAYHTNCSTC